MTFPNTAAAPMTTTVKPAAPAERGHGTLCVLLGLVLVLVGLFYLLSHPDAPKSAFSFGRPTVNLQHLFVGATFTISGVIFLAAALRPR
jgi:hypothetical protein